MQPLTVAIIGCGRIGSRHAKVIQSDLFGKVRLIAAADVNPSKKIKFSESFGIPCFSTTNELLHSLPSNLNLAIVCTSSGDHFRTAKEILNSGINVLIEKPITLRLSDAEELIKLAERNRLKIYVVKQNRFNPAIQFSHKAFKDGVIGKPFFASIRVLWCRNLDYYQQDSWRGTWSLDGGALINQAIHHLDILQWFLGDVDSVSAIGGKVNNPRDAFDTIAGYVRFKNGVIASVQVSSAVQPKDLEASFGLFGTAGSFEIAGKSLNKVRLWETPNFPNLENDVKELESEPIDVYGFGHSELLKNVVKDLVDGNGYVISGREATKSLRLASGIIRAAETSEIVYFDKFSESRLLGTE